MGYAHLYRHNGMAAHVTDVREAGGRLQAPVIPSLTELAVVLAVLTNPEPHEVVVALNGEGSVREAYSSGPEPTDSLEVQTGVDGSALRRWNAASAAD
jgi:hypothetical protein